MGQRLTAETLHHPATVIGILNQREMDYAKSVDDGLPAPVRRRRLEAWRADARMAAAYITNGEDAMLIRASLERAMIYAE